MQATGDSEVTGRQVFVDRPTDGLTGVVLAAGEGRRLRPLTIERPKALCPVANRPLLDHAIDRVAAVSDAVAVNAHHGRGAIEAHLAGSPVEVHLSIEDPVALGTAGALGHLRPWIDGRAVLVTNADAWLPLPADAVAAFVAGWDGERTRLLCVDDPARSDFGSMRYAGLALLPWAVVATLPDEPAGLYEVSWRAASQNGGLDLVRHDGPFVDCGTPGDYLAANLASLQNPSNFGPKMGSEPSSGPKFEMGVGVDSVVGEGAVVLGRIERCVIWPGAKVLAHEELRDAIRTPHRTVLVR